MKEPNSWPDGGQQKFIVFANLGLMQAACYFQFLKPQTFATETANKSLAWNDRVLSYHLAMVTGW